MSRQHGDSHLSECWMGLEEWVGACQVNRSGGGDEGSDRGNVNGMGCSAGCGEKELRLAVSIMANTKQVRTIDRSLGTGAEEWPVSSSCTQSTLNAYIPFPFLFSSLLTFLLHHLSSCGNQGTVQNQTLLFPATPDCIYLKGQAVCFSLWYPLNLGCLM